MFITAVAGALNQFAASIPLPATDGMHMRVLELLAQPFRRLVLK